jgi:ribose transport system permease protein
MTTDIGTPANDERSMKRTILLGGMTQERIVLALAILLFIVASVALRGFLTGDNLIAILRSVSVLGILAVGMAIVIIGRGIDLSAVAIMAMSVAWYLEMLNRSLPDGVALPMALLGVVFIGALNGFLIAYAEVPAIFATLASGAFVFGLARSRLIGQDVITVPKGHWVATLGQARLLHIPVEVFLFAATW